MVAVLHSSTPRARKDRRCDSCYRTIAKGEVYLNQDCVYDGSRYGYSACAHCRVVSSWVYRTQDIGWWDDGLDLGEYLRAMWRDSMTLARLRVYFERKWRRQDGTLADPASLVPASTTGSEQP
jgi:hypothetical protein